MSLDEKEQSVIEKLMNEEIKNADNADNAERLYMIIKNRTKALATFRRYDKAIELISRYAKIFTNSDIVEKINLSDAEKFKFGLSFLFSPQFGKFPDDFQYLILKLVNDYLPYANIEDFDKTLEKIEENGQKDKVKSEFLGTIGELYLAASSRNKYSDKKLHYLTKAANYFSEALDSKGIFARPIDPDSHDVTDGADDEKYKNYIETQKQFVKAQIEREKKALALKNQNVQSTSGNISSVLEDEVDGAPMETTASGSNFAKRESSHPLESLLKIQKLDISSKRGSFR